MCVYARWSICAKWYVYMNWYIIFMFHVIFDEMIYLQKFCEKNFLKPHTKSVDFHVLKFTFQKPAVKAKWGLLESRLGEKAVKAFTFSV